MNLEFLIGENEKHVVSFRYSQFWGMASLMLDGIKIKGGLPDSAVGSVKSYLFSIGNVERHQIRIDKHHRQPFAGFRKQKFRVFVDDKLIYEAENASGRIPALLALVGLIIYLIFLKSHR